MRHINSLRFKFISMFMISIFIPVIVIMYAFPLYYEQQTIEQSNLLINNTLTSISQNITTYLNELQYLAALPYFDKEVMSALEFNETSVYEGPTPKDKKSIDITLSSALPSYLKISRKDILSIIIIDEDGSVLYSNRNRNVTLAESYNFLGQDWYKDCLKQDGVTVFLGTHQPEYFTNSGSTRVISVARAIKHPYINKRLAVVMADADVAMFENMLSDLKFGSSSISLLLDDKGGVIYSTQPVSKDMLKQINNNSTYIKEQSDSYNVFSQTILPARWKIVVLNSDSDVQKKVRWIFNVGIGFAFLALALTALIFTVLAKQTVTSFEDMISVMKKVEKGNLGAKCSITGNDEISYVKKALNKMIERLNEMINKEYRLVLDQRNAEYRALQSQIQPHFLYNTLNGFLGLNRLGERDTLEKSILNLTGMMRYTLGQDDTTTIEQEFNFLSRYCELQKLRFENRMNTHIDCSDEVKNFRIPKLLLQPLVENSIIHAVEPSDRPCGIFIKAEKLYENDVPYAAIYIDDDGKGYDVEKIQDKQSIGMSNVKERLKLSYPNSTFAINSSSDKGTHITIKIRIESSEDNENTNS